MGDRDLEPPTMEDVNSDDSCDSMDPTRRRAESRLLSWYHLLHKQEQVKAPAEQEPSSSQTVSKIHHVSESEDENISSPIASVAETKLSWKYSKEGAMAIVGGKWFANPSQDSSGQQVSSAKKQARANVQSKRKSTDRFHAALTSHTSVDDIIESVVQQHDIDPSSRSSSHTAEPPSLEHSTHCTTAASIVRRAESSPDLRYPSEDITTGYSLLSSLLKTVVTTTTSITTAAWSLSITPVDTVVTTMSSSVTDTTTVNVVTSLVTPMEVQPLPTTAVPATSTTAIQSIPKEQRQTPRDPRERRSALQTQPLPGPTAPTVSTPQGEQAIAPAQRSKTPIGTHQRVQVEVHHAPGALPPQERRQPRRIPPIIVDTQLSEHVIRSHRELRKQLKGDFTVDHFKGKPRYHPSCEADREALLHYFKTHGLSHHTYPMASERRYRIVLVLPAMEDPQLVADELDLQQVRPTLIKQLSTGGAVSQLTNKYLCTYSSAQLLQQARKVSAISGVIVRWEEYRNAGRIIQCHNCQSWGHVASACGRPFRCLRCATRHVRGACPKTPSDPVQCCNCLGEHPANARICPHYLKYVEGRMRMLQQQQRQQFPQQRVSDHGLASRNHPLTSSNQSEFPSLPPPTSVWDLGPSAPDRVRYPTSAPPHHVVHSSHWGPSRGTAPPVTTSLPIPVHISHGGESSQGCHPISDAASILDHSGHSIEMPPVPQLSHSEAEVPAVPPIQVSPDYAGAPFPPPPPSLREEFVATQAHPTGYVQHNLTPQLSPFHYFFDLYSQLQVLQLLSWLPFFMDHIIAIHHATSPHQQASIFFGGLSTFIRHVNP